MSAAVKLQKFTFVDL